MDHRKSRYGAMFLAILSTILFLFPIYWMFATSIKPMSDLFVSPPHLLPRDVTFAAYLENVFKNPYILGYIGNSFLIACGTMVVTLLLAAPAAYALTRLNLRGKGLILILLLASQMLPNIMLAMPFFILFSKLGLLNSFLGLIIANTTVSLPFAVLVLRPFFLSIPSVLDDAAAIDGCNKWTTFWRVILPLIKPGMLTVGAFCFLFGWGDFLFAMLLTTEESIRPLTLGLYKFIGQYGTQWNNLMAVATVAAIPIVIIFITLQKYIVSGLTSGAVKD